MPVITTPSRANVRPADAPPRVEVMVSPATVAKALALSLGILLVVIACDAVLFVLLATVLVLGLDPPVTALERRGLGRGKAALLVFGVIALTVTVIVVWAVAPVWTEVRDFITNLPGYLDEIRNSPALKQLLLRPPGWAPAELAADEVVAALPCVKTGAHSSVVTQSTPLHALVAEASGELARARRRLDTALEQHGLAAAVAGNHPFASGIDPTLGLRIRVAVPDADDASRALDGIRRHLPALVALAGNSPLRRGRDTGFASSRLVLLSTRPRTGIPPPVHSYERYVRVVTALGALARRPPATAVRWDARLQPSTGTLEVHMLDAQTRVDDAAALAALVQCLVRMHADPLSPVAPAGSPRMLEDNRLRAARDGTDALLAVDRSGTRRHVRFTLEHLVDASLPAADELGCVTELIDVTRLITAPGAGRQRALLAARRGGRRSANLRALVAALHDQFTSTNAHVPDRRLAA